MTRLGLKEPRLITGNHLQSSLVAEQDALLLNPFPSPLRLLLHTPRFSILVLTRGDYGRAIARTATERKECMYAYSFMRDEMALRKDDIITECNHDEAFGTGTEFAFYM